MIDRYAREEMKNIWELGHKFQYYLDVELAVCEAYCEKGIFSREILSEIRNKASFSVERIEEIENEVKHDVIAFISNVSENIGENSKYIHMGLTSSDVIDTALSLQIKAANNIIKKDIEKLLQTIKNKAIKYKNTVCIGRSHGIHAEPMTFGLKMLNWFDILLRNAEHFYQIAKELEVGQISGPVGTYSNIAPDIEQIACEFLGLKPAKISTQIIARDYHANYFQCLALIASVIEQFATEIRHLQRTEVNEVQENFTSNQKGSSAMPHKKNPVSAENLCGLARVIRANASASLENIVLWHERDISHSSVERIIFPDTTILIDYMLNRFNDTLDNLIIKEKNMLKNVNSLGGIVFSQKVLLKLTEKGLLRDEAYKIVQKHALNAFENNLDFKDLLLKDEGFILSEKEIEECFDISSYLKNIDTIYKKFDL